MFVMMKLKSGSSAPKSSDVPMERNVNLTVAGCDQIAEIDKEGKFIEDRGSYLR